jgi:hypothetical protein
MADSGGIVEESQMYTAESQKYRKSQMYPRM